MSVALFGNLLPSGKSELKVRGTFNLFSDGGIRRKPAAASSAVVVKDEHGQVVNWFSRVLPAMSSSEAEYHGILDALELAYRLRPCRAYFHLDNQTVVGQVAGKFAVRGPKLKPLHARAVESIKKLQAAGCIQIEFYHIPREYNLLADALAADALLIMPHKHRLNMRERFASPGG
jgi:ribonuclease HI